MKNKIRAILLAAAVGTMVLAQGQMVSAASLKMEQSFFPMERMFQTRSMEVL